jgi:hypothetical protein
MDMCKAGWTHASAKQGGRRPGAQVEANLVRIDRLRFEVVAL